MSYNTDREAIVALRDAQLVAGHLVTTRKQYRAWMLRYRLARKGKLVADLQGFLSYFSWS
jgi:hypothetical protein